MSESSGRELLRYLQTIRDTISNELRPELQTDAARRSADALVLTLGRLVERVGDGDELAVAQIPVWDDLTASLPSSSFASAQHATLSPRERLESQLAQLQRTLQSNGDWTLCPNDPAQLQWLKSTAHALDGLWAGIEANVRGPKARHAADAATTDIASLRMRLDDYLRKRFTALPSPAVLSLVLYYGGYGKQSAKVTLAENQVLPRTLVLRRDIALSNTSTRAADEFLVLQRAYALGLPVPKPLLAEADPGILDGTFVLMEEVADAVSAGATFEKDRVGRPRSYGEEYGRDMARTLATLHSKTEVLQRTSAERERTRDALLAEIRELQRAWLAMPKPPLSAGVDLGFALLLGNALPPERPYCLVHSDCGMHNCLVRDGKLVALLDWELTHEGDPAEDLAIIRMLTADDVIAWPDFVREYIAAGGNPAACDPWAVAYHAVLLLIRHAMMAANVRANYHADVRTDAIAASVASHITDRLLQYQARALAIAVDKLVERNAPATS